MSSPSQVFTDYLSAFTSGDMETAQSLIADDFAFNGPLSQVEGKQAFFAGATQLTPIIRGFKMLRQFEDGDEVCSIYEFEVGSPATPGSTLMTEWCTVRDGQLSSSRLVFDTAAFGKLMPVPAAPQS